MCKYHFSYEANRIVMYRISCAHKKEIYVIQIHNTLVCLNDLSYKMRLFYSCFDVLCAAPYECASKLRWFYPEVRKYVCNNFISQ